MSRFHKHPDDEPNEGRSIFQPPAYYFVVANAFPAPKPLARVERKGLYELQTSLAQSDDLSWRARRIQHRIVKEIMNATSSRSLHLEDIFVPVQREPNIEYANYDAPHEASVGDLSLHPSKKPVIRLAAACILAGAAVGAIGIVYGASVNHYPQTAPAEPGHPQPTATPEVICVSDPSAGVGC